MNAARKEKVMNIRTLLAAAVVALAPTAPTTAAAQSDFINGQVTKVDESAGKITIKHGPLKKFDMEDGMTMVFRAGDAAMLRTVKAGDRIKFIPERINGQFTVTRIEKAK
jgi:Cu/Ag efflux protein CusF